MIKFKIHIFQLIAKILLKKRSLNELRQCLIGHIQIWHFFIKKYFNDFQNQNFSDLWLKWTQTVQMKQNQAFFHKTYSNLTSYLFSSKNIKVFQWLSNRNFSVFCVKWIQTMEMEQNQTFFHQAYSNLTKIF